jgi:WD40 repeat protein
LEKKTSVETINYHIDNVWVVKYSPNGEYLASGSEGGLLVFHKILNWFYKFFKYINY